MKDEFTKEQLETYCASTVFSYEEMLECALLGLINGEQTMKQVKREISSCCVN